jgi:hypothetical protein
MAAFTVIDHTELTGTTASWSKTSIPSSYDHLYLCWSARSDHSAYRDAIYCNVNSDTGSNYSMTHLFTGSGTPSSYRTSGVTAWTDFADNPGANVLADTFGTGSMWLPHYSNSANFKQCYANSATENNSTTDYQWGIQVIAGLWSSTAAVTALALTLQSGDFVQYSSFTLYGVTGA